MQIASIARISRNCLLCLVAASFPQMVSADGEEAPRQIGRIRTPELREISGLVASRRNPETLWVHNDGNVKEIFAVSTAGARMCEVRLPKGVDDVEDIAIGPGKEAEIDYVYVGDIGDNESRRRKIRLIRFLEPDLATKSAAKLLARDVEVFELKYTDGPHDAEALMIDPVLGEALVVTKEVGRSRIYGVALSDLREDAENSLELLGYLTVDEVSGGDISASGNLVALRNEDRGWVWRRRPGESAFAAMQRAPRIVLTRSRGQGQNGESIGFHPAGRGYYTVSEGPLEPIYIFPLPMDLREAGG